MALGFELVFVVAVAVLVWLFVVIVFSLLRKDMVIEKKLKYQINNTHGKYLKLGLSS